MCMILPDSVCIWQRFREGIAVWESGLGSFGDACIVVHIFSQTVRFISNESWQMYVLRAVSRCCAAARRSGASPREIFARPVDEQISWKQARRRKLQRHNPSAKLQP